MLARSTACRHGVGRTSENATSISRAVPSRTRMLAGFTSRCAIPASHSFRIAASAVSMTPTSTGSLPISRAPSRNSVRSRYSRWGVISTKPYVLATGIPESRITRSR